MEQDGMKRGTGSRNAAFGFIPLIVLVLLVGITAMLQPRFFVPDNLVIIFRQAVIFVMLACACALTVCSKGVDISLPAVMGYTAVLLPALVTAGMPLPVAVLTIILIAAAIGFLIGFVVVRAKISSILLTLVFCIAIRITARLVFGATRPVPMRIALEGWMPPVFFFAAVGVAFAFIFFALPGRPRTRGREAGKPFVYVCAYVAASVMAAFAGVYFNYRLQGMFRMTGIDYELFIVFIAAALYTAGSKALDHRFVPALYAAALAFLWTAFFNVMTLSSVNSFMQAVVIFLVVIAFVVAAFLTRRKQKA